jgi:hypothetical protein
MCALVSQHNGKLGYKPSSITILSENDFPNFHHEAWNLDKYWKLSNYDSFLCRS